VSYFAGYEPYPSVNLGPDLGKALGIALGSNPDLPRAAAAAANAAVRLAAGDSVFQATYNRRHVAGFDLTVPTGPLLWRLDAGFSPEQTLYVTDASGAFVPVRRPTATYVVGLEYRYEEKFFLLAQWFHQITVTEPGDALFLVSPNFILLLLDVRYRLLDGDLELDLVAMDGVSQGDFVLTASVGYRVRPKLQLVAGISLFQGSKRGLGGYFDANDFVFVRFRADF
jgi:hypothetical protein